MKTAKIEYTRSIGRDTFKIVYPDNTTDSFNITDDFKVASSFGVCLQSLLQEVLNQVYLKESSHKD